MGTNKMKTQNSRVITANQGKKGNGNKRNRTKQKNNERREKNNGNKRKKFCSSVRTLKLQGKKD